TRLAMYPFNVAFKLPLGVATVTEWAPMPFDASAGKLFLVILLGFLTCQASSRLSWRFEDFTLFLVGVSMAVLHRRFLLVFVPFCIPLLAPIFARWLPAYDRHKEHHYLNAALMSAVIG